MLRVGDQAPDFVAESSNGDAISLRSLRGRKVVIYFYPKSFTPGCTAETKSFRDNYDELKALGVEVLGVSLDDLATQCRFAEAHRVTFPLIADRSQEISRRFGVKWPLVPIDKRVTFVLDENGVVSAVFRHEFQVLKHLDDVRRFLEKQRA